MDSLKALSKVSKVILSEGWLKGHDFDEDKEECQGQITVDTKN